MTKVVRRVPETLPDDSRAIGADDTVVYRGGRADPSSSVVVEGPDGVQHVVPADTQQVVYPDDLMPMQVQTHLDTLAVCQIAVLRLLRSLEIWTQDLEALIEQADLQSRKIKLQRAFFDHPRQEDPLDPMPSVALLQDGETKYAPQSLETQIEEDTADVFAPGTVLRKTSHADLNLSVVIWFAHKEERRGTRAAMERQLLAERTDDRSARRVAIPEYFDRVVRCNFTGVTYPDNSDSAQANQWVLMAKAACDVDVVHLVARPGYITTLASSTEVVESID